jgi:hypothetical protein
MGGKEPSYTVGSNVNSYKYYEKTVWRLPRKLKMELCYDPAIPPLGIFLKNVRQVTRKTTAHPGLLKHYSQ